MDRTRKGGTVSDITTDTAGISGATLTFETGFAWTAGANLGYLVVGDVIRFQTGATGRITSSVIGVGDTTKQKVVCVKLDGVTWTADETAGTGVGSTTTGTYGHVYNAQAEASSAPNGRTYLPEENWNYTTILRRSFKVSGTEATNRTYIGDGGAWYFEQENIEMKEFARDKEGLVMFGMRAVAPGSTPAVKTGGGLWEFAIDSGVKTTFAAATGITETDIQDTLKDLMVQGASTNLLGLCGSQIHLDAQRALKDYHIAGSINYGGFGGNEVGLDVQSYRLGAMTLDLVYYALFDDTAMVPEPATLSSAATDFSNAMLIIDMGNDDNGKKLISLKYKELNGSSRKFIHAYETGMVSPDGNNGGKVSNGGDYFSVHYLCELGLECRLKHRLGSIRAIS